MSELSAEVGIPNVGTAKGTYKREFELPYPLKVCEGRIIPIKTKGIINKEKWYMQVHQNNEGDVRTTRICLNSKAYPK